MTDSDTTAALQRALQRAVFHLLRAGIEGVKAIEAVVEELARIREAGTDGDSGRNGDEEEGTRRVRIEIE